MTSTDWELIYIIDLFDAFMMKLYYVNLYIF